MADVYIYDAVRTPRGKAKQGGGLADLSPQELVKQQIAALVARGGDAARDTDALLLGCVTQSGAQGGHIALISKLHAGLPDRTAAHTINNYCASGLTAIGQAVAKVASGQADAVLAGGVESMSQVPFMHDNAAYYGDVSLAPRARFIPPVLAADRLADAEAISRAELDSVAMNSQQRAIASDDDRALQASRIATGNLTGEECPRAGMDAAKLAVMQPAFGAFQDDFSTALDGQRFPALHTLGHAPPVCDGAGLAWIGRAGLDVKPRARVVAYAESGGDPIAAFTAGMAAMEKVLARAGLGLGEIDCIEFMEAFAVTIAKFLRDYNPDPARVNMTGGHLAKGHPMGATGAILTSTLLDCLDSALGRYGLVVATGATGVGAAMIVERLA